MSGFSNCASPMASGAHSVDVFSNAAERAAYQNIIDGNAKSGGIKISRVKVEIFDLSDKSQVRKYEKLWKRLLEKTSTGEVLVDTHKDLVHRPDGTSFWMKYVEYVELCTPSGAAYDK